MHTVSLAASFALTGTFLLSGFSKLRDPRGFVLAVLDYRVLPGPLAMVYGWALPFVEISCALVLVAGVWPRLCGLVVLGVLLSFVLGVGVNLARGRALDCHCFGSGGEPLGWVTVLRLLVLAGLAGTVITSGVAGWPALVRAGAIPTLLLSLACVVSLYIVRSVPAQLAIWRAPATIPPTRLGGCVSYAAEPMSSRLHWSHRATVLPPNDIVGKRG